MNRLKILIVADGMGSDIYEKPFLESFLQLGCDVSIFNWCSYFKGLQYEPVYELPTLIFKTFYYKLQNKFRFGPVLNKINRDILLEYKSNKPDLVFLYRPTHIFQSTIDEIKKNKKTLVFTYNNDDPFSIDYNCFFWFNYFRVAKRSDHVFVYRQKNIEENYAVGIKNTSILKSYFIKEKNYWIGDHKRCLDVVFIGHWENDGRDEKLMYLLENGIDLQVFGTGWNQSKFYDIFQDKMEKIKPVYGKEYNSILNKAKIALVFLSKINNDTYTRRCFEIPTTKALMMSEFTNDLASMFTPNDEAVYFSSKRELLSKVKYYLENDDVRLAISEKGYHRVISDGHEVTDRCRKILEVFNEKRKETK